MIQLRMRQNNRLNGAIPKGHTAAKFRQNRIPRAAVNQNLVAVGGLYKDRVALADVEKSNPKVLPGLQIKNRIPNNGSAGGKRKKKHRT